MVNFYSKNFQHKILNEMYMKNIWNRSSHYKKIKFHIFSYKLKNPSKHIEICKICKLIHNNQKIYILSFTCNNVMMGFIVVFTYFSNRKPLAKKLFILLCFDLSTDDNLIPRWLNWNFLWSTQFDICLKWVLNLPMKCYWKCWCSSEFFKHGNYKVLQNTW